MQSVNEYRVIEIADIDVWVPIPDARIDVAAKKQVNMFLSPYFNKITEKTKIPYPMACCAVAKSNIFLMTWLICNPTKMNAKHVKAEMTTNIPIAIGIQTNVTSIFALNLVSKFESNQLYLMDALVLMSWLVAIARQKSTLSCYGNFSSFLGEHSHIRGVVQDFGRSVNPISTKVGRLCPPNNTGTPGFSNLLMALWCM